MLTKGHFGCRWKHEIERVDKLSEGEAGFVGAVLGRAEAHTMRLACLYALLDASPVIREVHLQAALALWRYCEESARYVFDQSLGDPVAEKILKALRASANGLTRTEIRDMFARHRTGEEMRDLLFLGLIARDEIRRQSAVGRVLAHLHEARLAKNKSRRTRGEILPLP